MILETTGNGPLGVAVRGAIQRLGEEARTVQADDADLFARAFDCRAIVAAAAPDLLDGRLTPSPSPDRMRAVVGAANAPGVRLVVLVVPASEAYAETELVLKRDGIPYVILRCAPLVEELAVATDFHVTRSVWLGRGRTIALSTAADLEAAVRQALAGESPQGDTLDVASAELDLAEAIQRAARAAGARTEVHATAPGVSSVLHKLSGWLGIAKPPALELYERLGSTGG